MEDKNTFLTIIKDELIAKFLAFTKTNAVSQAIGTIKPKNQEEENQNVVTIKFFQNIAKTLPKFNLMIDEQKFETLPEIQPGIYEGGFKLWECESDATQFVLDQNKSILEFLKSHNTEYIGDAPNVLELGCGSGLFGIACLLLGANTVTFQDYNCEVLKLWTIPNLALNLDNFCNKVAFVDGDWADFNMKKLLDSEYLSSKDIICSKYDIIFGADILYETRNYMNIIKLIESNQTKNGIAVISSKAYYYGNGGSIAEFKQYIETSNLQYFCIKQIVTGISNRREIFGLKFKL